MNLQNFYIQKEPAPSTDWRVFGDICDNAGNIISTFGVDGTSVNQWWVTQDFDFQYFTVNQFALLMAQQIIAGVAE